MSYRVGDRTVGHGSPVYIIAEMAWGHEGSLETGRRFFDGAMRAGADAVGIHVTNLDAYMAPTYRCLDGQTLSAREGEESASAVYEYLDGINTSERDWEKLFAHAKEIGLHLCVMCNDEQSLAFVREHSPEMYAIPAASFPEHEFVRLVAREGKPTVLRVGGASLDEIHDVVQIFSEESNPRITLLHGIQLYPTDIRDLNLSFLSALETLFGCQVGLADHIDGGDRRAAILPLLAIPLGATVIEKHITDARENQREDYEAALGFAEFEEFVRVVRSAEEAMGNASWAGLGASERKYRRIVRKKIVAARALSAGRVLARADVAFKRADAGGDPALLPLLLGRTTRHDLSENDGVDLSVLE